MQSKEVIHDEVKKKIESNRLKISGEDFKRPWGGFFKIADESLGDFLNIYFDGMELPAETKDLTLSPKILVVEPGKKLSWQSHERRSELWRVIKGPVGIYMSTDDVQPDEMGIYNESDTVEMQLGTRHRLAGLEDWGVIAEIWVHRIPGNPSDEDDIRRISDDFGR
ncbi:MAG: phosphoheptose isomerase [Ignavibacteria bacterium]|nr:phosphoheptose isomerase [Ignavibacteria bacterium]